MKTDNLLTVGVVLGLSSATFLLAKEFGPEWTRRGHSYYRTAEASVEHSAAGNGTNYKLQLDNDEVHITEIDDNQGFGFHVHPYGSFDVRKRDDGTVESYTVSLGAVRHHDLNGDGFIDAMRSQSGEKNRVYIYFEGRFKEVRDSRGGGRNKLARSLDGKTEYAFEEGQWKVKLVKSDGRAPHLPLPGPEPGPNNSKVEPDKGSPVAGPTQGRP